MFVDETVCGDGAEAATESLLIQKINYCEESAVSLFFFFIFFLPRLEMQVAHLVSKFIFCNEIS